MWFLQVGAWEAGQLLLSNLPLVTFATLCGASHAPAVRDGVVESAQLQPLSRLGGIIALVHCYRSLYKQH